MLRISVLSVIVLQSLMLSSPVSAHELTGSLFVDDLYDEAHLEVIKKDIENLKKFPIEKANSLELREITRTPHANSKEIFDWLQRWVHFIYPASYSDAARVYITKRFEIYTLKVS